MLQSERTLENLSGGAMKSAGLRKLLYQLPKHLCKSACRLVLDEVSRTVVVGQVWLLILCNPGKQFQGTKASTCQHHS